MKKSILYIFCALLVLACSGQNNSPMPTISDKAKANMARPVNCRTAPQDIKTLEDERASVAKQILSGVRTLMPISAVVGILTGDYGDRFEVTTGEYNQAIEKKIEQIKTTCKL